MQLYRALWIVVIGLAALPGQAADKEPSKVKLSEEEQAVLELTNQTREKENLRPLKLNPVLCEVARAHSANMAKQGKMEHVLDGKKPGERVKASGYNYSSMGENLAETDGDPPSEIFKRWMASPAHKEHILDAGFQEIGIGIARNDKGEIYYTQVFATLKKK
jgi:uncharacterized protein YkwD